MPCRCGLDDGIAEASEGKASCSFHNTYHARKLRPDVRRKLTVTENLVASGLAVVGATVVTHPIDVVKVQLQLSVKDAQADAFSIRRFVSFWAKFQSKVGLRGLFSGVRAAGLRAATYGSVRIGLCEPLQAQLGQTVGALAAGVLATVVGNPFEVLKVRLQAQPGAMGELQLLRSMLQDETQWQCCRL